MQSIKHLALWAALTLTGAYTAAHIADGAINNVIIARTAGL